MEKSATSTFIHASIAELVEDVQRASYLTSTPRCFMWGNKRCWKSISATIPGGRIHAGDMLFMSDGSLGKVVELFDIESEGDDLVAQLQIHLPIAGDTMRFETDSHMIRFASTADVVEPVSWKHASGFILAIVPSYV